jgi:hypothetical protein
LSPSYQVVHHLAGQIEAELSETKRVTDLVDTVVLEGVRRQVSEDTAQQRESLRMLLAMMKRE